MVCFCFLYLKETLKEFIINKKEKMYEHPIKRFGLGMNRIIYSNTMMVREGMPVISSASAKTVDIYSIQMRYRTFAAGKMVTSKGKFSNYL